MPRKLCLPIPVKVSVVIIALCRFCGPRVGAHLRIHGPEQAGTDHYVLSYLGHTSPICDIKMQRKYVLQ